MIALLPTLRITGDLHGDSEQFHYGIIGGLIALILVFIPLSPLLGGFISRCLIERGGDTAVESGVTDSNGNDISGFRIGVISGLIPFVPLTLVWVYFFLFMVGFPGGPPPLWYAGVVLLTGGLIIAVYTIVMGGIGGVLGSSLLKRDVAVPGVK